MGFSSQEYLSVCHSLLCWTMFCQKSPPWPICLGWPYKAWLIVSLSSTRLWSMWSDWLVFCDCGFLSVCCLMEKDKRLMEAYWSERLRGKLGLFLMGWAILSKSWIQFSVDGWGCVSSLLFDQKPNYGRGNEDRGDLLQKVPCTHSCTQYPQPCSRPPVTHTSVRDSWTLRRVWVSLLWGHCSFLLGLGVHKILFVPFKSLFPQSFVSSGGSMVGLMATSFKRAYAIPKPTQNCCCSPLLTHTSAGDSQTQF